LPVIANPLMINKFTLAKKLTSYSVIACSLLAKDAFSQVRYQKLAEPDTVFGGGSYDVGRYYLDLDGDGNNDFEIIDYASSQTFRFATIKALDSGSVFDFEGHSNSGTVGGASFGSIIYKPRFSFTGLRPQGSFVAYVCSIKNSLFCDCEYLWPFNIIYAVPLVLYKPDGTHYGWARMALLKPDTAKPGIIRIVIYDYAYQQTPDAPIVAGDTGFFNSTPPSIEIDSTYNENCKGYALVKTTNVPASAYLSWYKNFKSAIITKLSDSLYRFDSTDNGAYLAVVSYNHNTTATNSIKVDIVNPSLPEIPSISGTGDEIISSPAQSYQWYFNNSILPADTSQSVFATKDGAYQVEITDTNGCSVFSKSLEITSSDKVFLINRLLYVQIADQDFTGGMLNIIDEKGNSVIKQNVISNSFSINVNSLETGIYILELTKNENHFTRKIFVH
jgi:hypothetical protein